MTSTQHASQHSRYPLNNYPSGDLRLPSLKDLNFYRPPPGNSQESVPSHSGTPNDFVASAPDHVARHAQWGRSTQSGGLQGAMPPHSQHSQPQPQSHQHSPPLSAGHDMTEQSVQYNKHDGVYARPGIPLSAQVTPVPGSVNTGPAMRGEDASPHSPAQSRRPRPPSTTMSAARDGRPSHNSYPAPYNTYPSNQPPSNSPYHQIPNQNHTPHSAATSPQEQLNHNIPVPNHPGYNGYQQHYMQSRQSVQPPQHAPQPPQPHHHQQLPHQTPQPPSHPTASQHILHPHHSQQQQQQQQQQQPQQQQQQQPPPAPTPTQPPNQSSVHPSSLLQHPSQQSHPHHNSNHQSSHSHQSISHQPQHQQIANHTPHGNPYPSPNPAVHQPQSPWTQQSHPQPSHHQALAAPSHTQQTSQQSLPPSAHPHSHHTSHHPPAPHHQPNSVSAPNPQPVLQQAQQHPHPQHQQHQQHAPPPLQPSQPPQPSQPQHHPPHHTHAPTPIPHHAQHTPHHPPAQPQQHAQQHSPPVPPQSQPQAPQQQLPFARAAPVVQSVVEPRSNHYPTAPAPAPEPERAPDHNDPMNEIVKHCTALYVFANHYASAQHTMPHVQPSPSELQDMSQKALRVVRLLEDFKRAHLPESERNKMGDPMHGSSEDHRAPKRPWEDMGQDGVPNGDQTGEYPSGTDKAQSTAEQDMQIIRSKRATSTAGASTTAGQTKSKYRKRSRATPPGKCHSCNIRETPEWRRGPDGARTLCNACGLHYAKLMRKRDKTDPTGQTPRIDLETLRASARAAESSDKSRSKHKNVAESSSPADTKPNSQQHHQGSFQLMNVMAQDPNPASSEPNRTIPPPQTAQAPPPPVQAAPSSLPVPPWATSAQQPQPPPPAPAPAPAHGRAYPPEHLQHQSFMRTSQHTSAPQASSR